MSYAKQTWDTTSYVNPTRMNHIEDGIKGVSDEIDNLSASDVAYSNSQSGLSAAKVQEAIDEVARKIKKKSYTFSSFTENCMVTDLNTANSVIVGIRITNRYGWNLIARNGVSGSVSSNVWVITDPMGASLSGTFEVDVCYISI